MNARFEAVSGFVVGTIVLALGVAFGRTIQLQLWPDERIRELVGSRLSAAENEGIRGDLLDRRGRLLSTTRFAHRVFIDPVRFPDPPHEAIAQLSGAVQLDAGEVGSAVLRALSINDARATAIERWETSQHAAVPDADGSLLGGVEAIRAAIEKRGNTSTEQEKPKPLVRYAPLKGVHEPEIAAAVRKLRLPGVHVERVPVRSYPGGEIAANLVGKVGWDHAGLLGAERALDGDLGAAEGTTRFVRDARGNPLWMAEGDWQPVTRGASVALSIDLELQRIAQEEIARGIEEADAAGGRVVVIDPATGEVLAMVDLIRSVSGAEPTPWVPREPREDGEPHSVPVYDWEAPPRFAVIPEDARRLVHPSLARNRCVEDVYEPGSTFKPFVWSILTAAGLSELDETIDTEGGVWRTAYGRPVQDVTRRDEMTWSEVLTHSSNIGMAKIGERMDFGRLRSGIRSIGFGTRTGIGLPGESPGLVTSARNWSKYTHTSVCFGYEVAVTPLQLARAFCLFARSGELAGTLPRATLLASTDRGVIERVLPSDAALAARAPMLGTAERMTRQIPRIWPGETTEWSHEIFGKSGTARIAVASPPAGMRRPRGFPAYYPNQYHSSFLAAGPAEDPQLVVLVVIDDPGPSLVRKARYYGSMVAGPVVRRIFERSLNYLGVPGSNLGEDDRI